MSPSIEDFIVFSRLKLIPLHVYLKHFILSVQVQQKGKRVDIIMICSVVCFVFLNPPHSSQYQCFAACVHLQLCMCLEGAGVHGSECAGAATGVNTSWLRSVRVKWECSAVCSDHCETVPSNRDCLVGITTTVLETSFSRTACGFFCISSSHRRQRVYSESSQIGRLQMNKWNVSIMSSSFFKMYFLFLFLLQCIAALFLQECKIQLF